MFAKGTHKDQYREVAAFVAQQHPDYREQASLMTMEQFPDFYEYYLRKNGLAHEVTILAGGNADVEDVSKYLNAVDFRYLWYLIGGIYRPEPDFMKYLNEEFKLVTEKDFYNTRVMLFESRKPGK